jgi:branched-chain amino acid transport system substrate-binding protein
MRVTGKRAPTSGVTRRTFLRTAAAGAALTLPGLRGAALAQKPAGSEIRVGAEFPFAGLWADWGRKDRLALEIAVEEVNAEGGINGVPVKIYMEDTGSKPQDAGMLTRKLATDQRVLAILGPFSSGEAEVAFPLGNQLKVSMIAQASSKPGVGAANRPWAFRMNIDEARYAERAVKRFVKDYSPKSVAVIHDVKDPVGQIIGSKILPGLLKQHGVALVNEASFLTFQSRDIDFSAQVTRLKGMHADGIAFGGAYSDAVTFLKEARRQGLRQPMVGGNPLMHELFPQQAGEAAEGTVTASFFWAGSPEPRVQGLVKKFAARAPAAGVPPTIEMINVNTYDAMHLLADVMRKHGVTNRPDDLAADREKIMKALTATKSWPGVSGKFGFNEDGDGVKDIYVFMVKGGKWVKVE